MRWGRRWSFSNEINQLLAQKVVFTQGVCDYLREKHLKNSTRSAVESATHDTRQMLSKVVSMVQEYSQIASETNKQIGANAEKLASGDEDVDDLLGQIVAQLHALSDNGDAFTSKLEDSRREIDNLRESLERVTMESKKDFLTGALNRRALDEALEVAVEDATRNGHSLSLLMVDIDHFKQFNDRLGHAIGDEVLKTVARALKQSVRGRDTVARYGGEEFFVLLAETPIQGARVVAESLRKTIANAQLTRRDTKESLGQITVSIGVSHWSGAEDSIPFMLQRADKNLYAAKASGRNRVVSEA